ncbi:HNH endonuclease, partial [Streptomyces sp. TRM76130]|nr:HNH endonuclease [Streptomyces sp. TRM76130]
MRDTLVLNASFEPLSTVTLNRAVVLVLQDKAVVEQT